MCIVTWCDNKSHPSGSGYCRRHYDQIRKYGKVLNERNAHNKNQIEFHDDVADLILRNNDGNVVAKALIDIEDIRLVSKYKWSLKDNGYVRTVIKGKTVYLHRLLTAAKSGDEIDHINLNKLDNRKKNLRFCTHEQNCWNRFSVNHGVSKLKRNLRKPFIATITVRGKSIWLGYYATLHEATVARAKAEEKYHKEFRCNVSMPML
ncbi:HNH endonuclease [Sporolactobacillus nakayamae]|uniref:HNH endonuclease n=1 Tax=Sporolactobacillus nakayamae TaxID=269670 RepID=A0A1I2P2I0_9BACL|nr:HNH endonuclease [Sporolactobacillus nakayamae]SFG10382.1 HNH endonuclease [Sporolactobacillus nakayamae]